MATNGKLESVGQWGTVVQLTLDDGTVLKLTRRTEHGDTKPKIAAMYTVKGHETDTWIEVTATTIFDLLHDMTVEL